LKEGIIVAVIGFILNLLESWYFGWNMKAESVAEAFADNICGLIIMIGIAMFLITWAIHVKEGRA
jgi:nitrate reductase gamma subunit